MAVIIITLLVEFLSKLKGSLVTFISRRPVSVKHMLVRLISSENSFERSGR